MRHSKQNASHYFALYILLDVGLNYVSPLESLLSSLLVTLNGTVGHKGVGPAESTFLWESHHSLLGRQTLPASLALRKTHI